MDYGSGGNEPPLGGVFDIAGYTKPSIVTVRIRIRGRAPIDVPTIIVDDFPVRCFAILLPGRLGEVRVDSVVGLDADGRLVSG